MLYMQCLSAFEINFHHAEKYPENQAQWVITGEAYPAS